MAGVLGDLEPGFAREVSVIIWRKRVSWQIQTEIQSSLSKVNVKLRNTSLVRFLMLRLRANAVVSAGMKLGSVKLTR
jgi:hypothetical protein